MEQSAGYINTLENRRSLPSMTGFFYICEYLGVTPAEFFDDGTKYPVELRETINGLKVLNHDQLANISAIIKSMK